jgi:hypothetical protein
MKNLPSNWIEGMSWELKRERRKDNILRVFVWLIFIPTFSFLSWYGIYRLVTGLINR